MVSDPTLSFCDTTLLRHQLTAVINNTDQEKSTFLSFRLTIRDDGMILSSLVLFAMIHNVVTKE